MVTHCDIVIPVWNQLETTEACLESIIENTDYPYRVIIVDNKSDEPTASFLRSFSEQHSEKVFLIRSEENLGYIKGTNLGMKASTGDYVCLLNNDTIVYPGWLSAMVEVAELENDIGLVNPASNHFDMTHENSFAQAGHRYAGLGRVVGFCLLIKRELIDKIGYLDERFGMGYGEDDAYCRSAQNIGFRCVIAKRAYVYHQGKKSFGRDKMAKAYRERQRALSKELLGEQPKAEIFLSGNMASDKGMAILGLLRKMADKGVRCKVFLKHPLNSVPYEHNFVEFRVHSGIMFYISAIFRFLSDKRFPVFATDSPGIFKNAIRLNRLSGKKLFILADLIYGVDGRLIGYNESVEGLIEYMKVRNANERK